MLRYPNVPASALRAIRMHPKYAGYGYGLAILRITYRHPEYVYRLPKLVYPQGSCQEKCAKLVWSLWQIRSAGDTGGGVHCLQMFHIHVLLVAPLGTSYMTEPGTYEHER